MKLADIKIKTGFSSFNKSRYIVNKNCSVQYIGETLPADNDMDRWIFSDHKFKQEISGKFKDSVKKAIESHKHSTGSSFSNTLQVIRFT